MLKRILLYTSFFTLLLGDVFGPLEAFSLKQLPAKSKLFLKKAYRELKSLRRDEVVSSALLMVFVLIPLVDGYRKHRKAQATAKLQEIFDGCLQTGNYEDLVPYIHKGASLNYGQLSKAIAKNDTGLMDILTQKKPSRGALYQAIKANNVSMVKHLLAQGLPNGNKGLLVEAVKKNQFEIVKLLLQAGTDAKHTWVDHYSDTPFSIFGGWAASKTLLIEACIKNNAQIVELLLQYGADVNAKGTYAYIGQTVGAAVHEATPLIIACIKSNFQIVQKLINFGADLNAVDRKGISALGRASEKGNTLILKMLLDKRMDPNKLDVSKRPPLLYAIAGDHSEAVSLLLQYGADAKGTWEQIHPETFKKHVETKPLMCKAFAKGFNKIDLNQKGECSICLEEKPLAYIKCDKGCKNSICYECFNRLIPETENKPAFVVNTFTLPPTIYPVSIEMDIGKKCLICRSPHIVELKTALGLLSNDSESSTSDLPTSTGSSTSNT